MAFFCIADTTAPKRQSYHIIVTLHTHTHRRFTTSIVYYIIQYVRARCSTVDTLCYNNMMVYSVRVTILYDVYSSGYPVRLTYSRPKHITRVHYVFTIFILKISVHAYRRAKLATQLCEQKYYIWCYVRGADKKNIKSKKNLYPPETKNMSVINEDGSSV